MGVFEVTRSEPQRAGKQNNAIKIAYRNTRCFKVSLALSNFAEAIVCSYFLFYICAVSIKST